MNKNATAQLHVYSAFFVLAGFVLNRGGISTFPCGERNVCHGNRALSSSV